MQISDKYLELMSKNNKVPGGKFSNKVPLQDLVILQKGDVFCIPLDAQPVNVPIRGRKNPDGSPLTYEAVFAQLERNGRTLSIAIAPSVFCRSASIVDMDTLEVTGERAKCKGTAVDAFWNRINQGEDLDTAMKFLYGKDIKVSDIEKVSVETKFSSRPMQRSFYTLDFV